ncbi:hypothetical protein F5Y19DRAFT_478619 [Xylariaceae sp. FL1651]|nr:hypothetical protein F5Y19DRAFT_478619 [Xylariaceae sp. FL1651]
MSTLPPDPYRILGVSKDAQLPEIRSAHRKLVLKCHPDKIQDPGLKEAKQNEFQLVQQAYELLSNEAERDKYDRKVEVFNELAKERERAKNSSARAPSLSRNTPKREPVFYHVKEASPRASTFTAKPSPYGRTPPRSWEDTSSANRLYEEAARHARKTASYEKEKPSRREEERRRRKEDDDWAREKEKARDRELREARKAKERASEKERLAREEKERLRDEKAREEKERRKEEKKKVHSDREKEREKERKHASAEKTRSRYVTVTESSSEDEDDVVYEPPPKVDRKKSSSSRKLDDIDPPSASARERKYSGNMENAIRYLTRSGGKAPPHMARAQTYHEGFSGAYGSTPAVPTPPPAPAAPFPPPPPVAEPEEMSDDDLVRRSSARPSTHRMSHDTPRSSREKPSSHKKSSSSRDHQPIIVDAGSPPARIIPSLQKSHSERVPPLPRSHTETFARPIPVPGLNRAETWQERSRSRPSPYSDEEDSEDERERRHRRSRRNHSPEPMPAQTQHRYTVEGTKSIPMRQKSYHPEQPTARVYKTKGAYVMPNSSARVQRGHKAYARDYYEDEQPQFFGKVKYAAQFDERDINYSDLPYSASHRSDGVYAS